MSQDLASTYRNQGRWAEAEKLEVQVMEMSKTKLVADHTFYAEQHGQPSFHLQKDGLPTLSQSDS